MNIQEVIEGFNNCFIKEDCKECPYNCKFVQYECYGKLLDDMKMYLENYKDFLNNDTINN